MASKKFPKTIFVRREVEGADEYLIADTNADAADDGDAVAVYQLVSLRKKRIVHSLVEGK